MFAISATLGSTHWYALPRPERSELRLAHALAELRDPAGPDWMSVHALYAHCRCSQRILAHLLRRKAVPAVQEHVLLVGPQGEREAELRAAGFRVRSLTPLQLKDRFGVVALPLFVVADARDRPRYVGGYTSHPQGPEIRDRALLEALIAGEPQSELPLFGCAVSRSLQKLLDPFSLKY